MDAFTSYGAAQSIVVVGDFQWAKTELADMGCFEFVVGAALFTFEGFKSRCRCLRWELSCLGHGYLHLLNVLHLWLIVTRTTRPVKHIRPFLSGLILAVVGLVIASAAEGLQLPLTAQPDVAIVDVGLPDQDGIELTRQLKSAQASGSVAKTKV